MLKKILNIVFYLVLVYLVAASFYMANTNQELKQEINQLQQVNSELLLDKINLEIDLENALDAYWNLSNQLEKAGG
ncbi:hypothetical protein [Oceanobacillus sojae]|uniref:hypothetical protein n=1 Tax=Oceanobacillus sojae TaxID=582851 RepID=UPI0021A462E0|nr:hypothetical protein [Oceanobacillus sojae]MCT1904095.1 hypothetical protein [Oceanobacillus sojae]